MITLIFAISLFITIILVCILTKYCLESKVLTIENKKSTAKFLLQLIVACTIAWSILFNLLI